MEREIQHRKGLISDWESSANDYEERLGLLKEERECMQNMTCQFMRLWLTDYVSHCVYVANSLQSHIIG